jgi:pyridoxal phosphate enzyme (YggS family)
VDSIKLAAEIDRVSRQRNINTDVLLEVNIAGETSKHGAEPGLAQKLIEEMLAFGNITVKGLMTVAPYVEEPEENRKYFKKMTELFLDINRAFNNNIPMSFLSMGMTNDYQVAIEEGANMVRIGSGIFKADTDIN